ncbi:DNA primase [Pasteuria penetrans]|uniref:DNA primase n=1 Tax=Pasteuria penetrans TaxID=86005 RepID=UPI000FA01065|nr:DNA primase [Pasteuria penetrans]
MTAGDGRRNWREGILSQVDIVEVVARYVRIEPRGREWFGLCPFHAERTPSFTVSPTKQFFYCFGCSMSGDAIRFLVEMEGISTAEACERLVGGGKGFPVGPQGAEGGTSSRPQGGEQAELRSALQYAVALYQQCLLRSPSDDAVRARAYVEERQLAWETVSAFSLGFASGCTPLLVPFFQRRGFSLAPLRTLGLLTPHDQERFVDRLIIPIHDAQGRVVGLGGRSLPGEEDGQPKYLNSVSSPIFQKGEHLFNWHRARTSIRTAGRVVLLEGYMDVLTAWQAGIRHGVGVLGTSLSDAQARKLCRLQDRVVLAYDPDEAGERATLRSMDVLRRAGAWMTVAVLPAQMDPDQLVRTKGGEALHEVLQTAISATDFRLRALRRGYDLTQQVDRYQYLHCAMKVLMDATAMEREHHLRALSEEFSIQKEDLQSEWERVHHSRSLRPRVSKPTGGMPPSPSPYGSDGGGKGEKKSYLWSRMKASERLLLSMMMRSRSITLWVQQWVGDGFPTDDHAALAAHLYAYYAGEQAEEDPKVFLEELQRHDPVLKKEAEVLLSLEVPPGAADRVLYDCLDHLRVHPLLCAVEKNEEDLRSQQRKGNTDQALQLLVQRVELQRQRMAQQKTTQVGYVSTAPSPPSNQWGKKRNN